MSPNSSSKCLAGTNARSATLRTISAWPSLGSRSVVAVTLRHAQRAAPPPNPRACRGSASGAPRRWYRGAIVRGRRRVLLRSRGSRPRRARRVGPCSRSAAVLAAAALAAARLRRRLARTRANRRRRSSSKSCARASPPCRRSPSDARLLTDGAQPQHRRRSRTSPSTVDSLHLHLQLPGTRRQQAAGLGRRTRPRHGGQAAGRKPGSEHPRRRPDGLRQHLGARPAAGRADARRSSGRSSRSRPAPTRSTTPSPPASPGKAKARLARGRPRRRAASAVLIAPKPPADARRPEDRQVVPGALPAGRSSTP